MSRFQDLCPEYLEMTPEQAGEDYVSDLQDASDERLEFLEELNGNLAEQLAGEQDYEESERETEEREQVAACFAAIYDALVALRARKPSPDPSLDSQETSRDVRESVTPPIEKEKVKKEKEEEEPSVDVSESVVKSIREYSDEEPQVVSSCGGKKKSKPPPTDSPPPKPLVQVEQPQEMVEVLDTEEGSEEEELPERPPPCSRACQRFDDGWTCDSLVSVTGTGYDTSNTEIGYNAAQWLNALEGASVGTIVGWEALKTGASAGFGVAGKVFGGLAIAGGAIDFLLCLRRGIKTGHRISDLKDIVNRHGTDGPEGVEVRIARYALKKKWSKLKKTAIAGTLATVAIAAGIVGLAVSGPVGWGIALGLGLAAAVGAAGLLAWRYYRYRKKETERKRQAAVFAQRFLACARRGEDNHAFRSMPDAPRLGLTTRTTRRDQLEEIFLELDVSDRFVKASALVGLFVEDWTRIVAEQQQADSEERDYQPDDPLSWSLLSALNVNPSKMADKFSRAMAKAKRAGNDQPIKDCFRKYVDQVFGKLKSW